MIEPRVGDIVYYKQAQFDAPTVAAVVMELVNGTDIAHLFVLFPAGSAIRQYVPRSDTVAPDRWTPRGEPATVAQAMARP